MLLLYYTTVDMQKKKKYFGFHSNSFTSGKRKQEAYWGARSQNPKPAAWLPSGQSELESVVEMGVTNVQALKQQQSKIGNHSFRVTTDG